jgi:hypothetical protein
MALLLRPRPMGRYGVQLDCCKPGSRGLLRVIELTLTSLRFPVCADDEEVVSTFQQYWSARVSSTDDDVP